MLNLLPQDSAPAPRRSTPEPVARLASLRHALSVVDQFGGGPASDFDPDRVAAGWERASEVERSCFDRRSAALVGVAAAGLEVVSAHREIGGDVSPAALELLAEELRAGLEEIEKLIRD